MKHEKISPATAGVEETRPTKAELRAVLRADLEAAAAFADKRDEPMWRWLLELADEGRTPPAWGGRPNISRLVIDMGVKRHSAGRFAELIVPWMDRFLEAFGGLPEEVFRERALAAAKDREVADGDADLVEALEAEMAGAQERSRIVYLWLVEYAKAKAPLPMNGPRVNLRQVGRDMGVGYSKALDFGEILNRWAPRFDKAARSPLARRDTLPGEKRKGIDIPTNILIEAIEKAIPAESDEDARKVLEHLLHRARNGRVVPRSHAQAHLIQLLRDAEVEDQGLNTRARETLDQWVGFFKLDEFVTTTALDGTVTRRPVVAERVRKFIEELRNDPRGPQPLLRDPRSKGPSFAWVGRENQLSDRQVRAGEPARLIREYWASVPGDVDYEGRTSGEAAWRRERRAELLAYVKEQVDAGEPLPAKSHGKKSLDHDELVRRSGKPGHNLADDHTFIRQVAQLKPKLKRLGATPGVPQNYAQLIAGVQDERVKSVGKGSVASTRGAVERAIRSLYTWHGKKDSHPIGNDLDADKLETTMKEMKAAGACGSQPGNWATEINYAKRWFDKRSTDDMLGDAFDVVLLGAIQRDGRALPDLVAGIEDLSVDTVTDWMRGESLPTKEQLAPLKKLETRLKLDEGRLSKLIEKGIGSSAQARAGVNIPPGVREFLPDDWHKRSAVEQAAMAAWIDDNIVHQNSVYGRTMREVQKKVHARKRALKEGAKPAEAEQDDRRPNEEDAVAVAPADDKDVLGKWIDRQLSPEATGLPERLLNELKALRRHMTIDMPRQLLRRKRSKWEDRSTAQMKMGMLVRFFRWQVSSMEEGGLGRDAADLTLADFVHPPLAFAYVDYKARALEHVEYNDRKRGKVFTSTEVDFLRTAASLVSKEFGFVTQREDLAARITPSDRPLDEGSFINLEGHVYDKTEKKLNREAELAGVLDDERLPDVMPAGMCGLVGEAWLRACRKAELAYGSAQEHVNMEADMIRDPAEPIQPILDSARPMTVLLRQIALASRREPDVGHFELKHHMHKRDLLMARLFALTTVRNRNMREITIDGPSPKLRLDKTREEWVLEIPWREFKNWRNSILFGRPRKRQNYKKWLADTQELYELLRYYVEVSRPWFIKRGIKSAAKRGRTFKMPNELFLSSMGKRLDGAELWRCMRKFTARHFAWNPFREEGLPLCQPFGPHAFRDIRATDILLNPETSNPFLEAAYALQTSPTMIQNHYGVVRTEKRTAADDVSFLKREREAWAGLA